MDMKPALGTEEDLFVLVVAKTVKNVLSTCVGQSNWSPSVLGRYEGRTSNVWNNK
jgi:hypothetical protein